VSSVERAALLLTSRYFEDRFGDLETSLPAKLRFSTQLVSVPFFWQRFPTFKQVSHCFPPSSRSVFLPTSVNRAERVLSVDLGTDPQNSANPWQVLERLYAERKTLEEAM
jgi:hypothetical protein